MTLLNILLFWQWPQLEKIIWAADCFGLLLVVVGAAGVLYIKAQIFGFHKWAGITLAFLCFVLAAFVLAIQLGDHSPLPTLWRTCLDVALGANVLYRALSLEDAHRDALYSAQARAKITHLD